MSCLEDLKKLGRDGKEKKLGRGVIMGPKSPLQYVKKIGNSRMSIAQMAAAISSTLVLAARRGTTPLACSLSSSSKLNTRRLVLYSKPGCCLCDGLKEKLHAAFSLSTGPDSLHDVTLQVRDITTNPEWERAYQYEIPVLAKENPDGKEEILPRLSPRLSVEIIQKKLLAAFS